MSEQAFTFEEIGPEEVGDLLFMVQDAMPEFAQRPEITWKPNQLYGALFMGLADLIVILKNYEPCGFIITRWMLENPSGLKYMHVWLFYLKPDQRGKPQELMDSAKAYLKERFIANGAAFMEFQTTKGERGWSKFLGPDMPFVYATYRMRA